jgi:hypothetical protein
MKMCVAVELQGHELLNSILDGGEWSASCPGQFTAKEKKTDWIGYCVGHKEL